jgi:hypothetical protein
LTTSPNAEAEALKAVVRRNTEQVQGHGDFALSDELFADDFVDHTPQPGTTPDKAGVRVLYERLRQAFPYFRPEIHWQTVEGDVVTTFKIYHGTQRGDFLGIAPTVSRSNSKRSTPCGSAMGRSPTTGVWPTCIPSCSNSDNCHPRDCVQNVQAQRLSLPMPRSSWASIRFRRSSGVP